MNNFDETLGICRAIKSNRHILFYIGNRAISRLKSIPCMKGSYTFKEFKVELIEEFRNIPQKT